jgi:hypothetical protein
VWVSRFFFSDDDNVSCVAPFSFIQIKSDSSDEASDLEEMWYKKLQDELDDEYSQSWGSFEQGNQMT